MLPERLKYLGSGVEGKSICFNTPTPPFIFSVPHRLESICDSQASGLWFVWTNQHTVLWCECVNQSKFRVMMS